MIPAIVICGTTASGKTDLALQLAEVLSKTTLISADSRHVYKNMTIGTGKDIPKGWEQNAAVFGSIYLTYYANKNTRLWLYDMTDPSDSTWSVQSLYAACDVLSQNYLIPKKIMPVIVGGDGFYIRGLLEPYESMQIPPDTEWRTHAEKLSVQELQTLLQSENSVIFDNSNMSDRKNPRRLIRAIERARYLRTHEHTKTIQPLFGPVLYIGLTCSSLTELQSAIEQRVRQRITQGMVEETTALMAKYPDWSAPAFTATGYREVRAYIEKKISLEDAIAQWTLREFQYAKRQLTWFRKNKNVRWFTTDDLKHKNTAIVEMVKNWYDEHYAATQS